MLYETRYQKLREELITARSHANLTQMELASQLGKVQSFVSKVETGERYLDVLEFLRWCEATKANAAEIIESVLKIKTT